MDAIKISRYEYLLERRALLAEAAWSCACPKLMATYFIMADKIKEKALASRVHDAPMTRRAHQLETCLEALA